MIEQSDKRVYLLLPKNYREIGIPELLDILVPHVRYTFLEYDDFDIQHDNPMIPDLLKYRFRIIMEKGGTKQSLSLSQAAIDRIIPLDLPRDFLVIHTRALNGLERRYEWDKVDFTDVNYKLVGAWTDNDLPGHVMSGSFLKTAQLLRASKGFLGVNSSVMCLANLLRVPMAVIYPNAAHYRFTPCLGVPMIKPRPEEVRRVALALLA